MGSGCGTAGGSGGPGRICRPAGNGRAAGRWTGCRITWRPACPGFSWPAPRGPNRPSGSHRRSARAPWRSCWCTATWRSYDRRTVQPVAATFHRSAGRGKGGRQDGPVWYAEAAGKVVADGGLAASDSGEVVSARGDVEERPALRYGLVEPSVGQPDRGTAGAALRTVDQGRGRGDEGRRA